jgi:hypothetical protein
LLAPVGAEVIGKERIEVATGQAQLFRGLSACQGPLPEGSQDMADEGRRVAIR